MVRRKFTAPALLEFRSELTVRSRVGLGSDQTHNEDQQAAGATRRCRRGGNGRSKGWLRWRDPCPSLPKQTTNLRVPLQRSDDRAQWQNPCDTKRWLSLLVTRAINIHRTV